MTHATVSSAAVFTAWVFAFVFFVIAALTNPPDEPRRTRLIAGGLACIAAAVIISRALGVV